MSVEPTVHNGEFTVLTVLDAYLYTGLLPLRHAGTHIIEMTLPIRTTYNLEDGGLPSRQSIPVLQRIPVIFRRLHRFQQMASMLKLGLSLTTYLYSAAQDFELALWQLTYLCISPRRV